MGKINLGHEMFCEDLLDRVAGDSYEGWETYWEDRTKWVHLVLYLLEVWQDYAQSQTEGG